MRIYPRDDEQRIRIQTQVRAWARAGLLDAQQGSQLDTALRTDLRRTNIVLRLVLAFFTAVIVAASVGFVLVVLSIRRERAIAVLCGLAAAISYVTAEWLVRSFRLYRFGVEEALTAAAVVLAAIATVTFWIPPNETQFNTVIASGCLAAAIGSFAVYQRFGYVYAGIAAMALLAYVPFLSKWPLLMQRTAAAAILLVIFAVARAHHRRHGDDYPGDETATLQAAAWTGVYLVSNLQITILTTTSATFVPPETWFYWGTYGVIWLMPIVGLLIAIREKDRSFLAANLALMLATFVTNKPYLGWPRYSWDPMILGVTLAGSALGLRRWLASGPRQQRSGFTPVRLLEEDRDAVTRLGTVSAAIHPQITPAPEVPDGRFGGGRSGGGGASGSF